MPAAPTTSLSGSNVVISWTAPNRNGGIPTYTVKFSYSSVAGITLDNNLCNPGLATTCTIAISTLRTSYDLLPGNIGMARVSANNDFGTSDFSPEGNFITLSVPDVPAKPKTTSTLSSNLVTVDWDAPAQGSTSILDYTVFIK